jgi:hypothetical protein
MTSTQAKQVLRLSNRNGNSVMTKFDHEAKRFLENNNTRITKIDSTGRRYEQGCFEMIYLEETNKFYFVTN